MRWPNGFPPRGMPRSSFRLPTVPRPSIASASVRSIRGARRTTSPSDCRRKSSSSPGSLADLYSVRLRARRCVWASAGAQLSSLRSLRLQLDRAHSAAVDTRQWLAPAGTSRPDDRGRVLHRHALLDHARHGGVWRPAGVGGCARQCLARRVPRALPRVVRNCRPLHGRKARIRRAVGRPARLGRYRAGSHAPVQRVSVGAARIQPGGCAAHCATARA